jgi:hypothetical protein
MILPWKYISNQLDSETERSVQEAVTLSLHHDSALRVLSQIIPTLLPLYTRYHPLHQSFMDGYSNLSSVGGLKQGDRISVKEALVTAKTTLTNVWLPTILILYVKKSARYISLFPKGMKSFTTKGIDARITAYATLAKNMDNDADLATIKDAVLETYGKLLSARSTQNGAKTTTKMTSGKLDELRTDAMNMQYRNLGFIMDQFFDTRETLCPLLFDLKTLRVNPQTVFTGKLIADGLKAVLGNTFVETDSISVKLNQACKIFLSNTIGGINSTGILVPANIKTTIKIADFGVTNYAAFRFITIVNQEKVVAKYSITLL